MSGQQTISRLQGHHATQCSGVTSRTTCVRTQTPAEESPSQNIRMLTTILDFSISPESENALTHKKEVKEATAAALPPELPPATTQSECASAPLPSL